MRLRYHTSVIGKISNFQVYVIFLTMMHESCTASSSLWPKAKNVKPVFHETFGRFVPYVLRILIVCFQHTRTPMRCFFICATQMLIIDSLFLEYALKQYETRIGNPTVYRTDRVFKTNTLNLLSICLSISIFVHTN